MKRRQFSEELGREEQAQNRRGTKRAHRELREHEHDDKRQVRMLRLVLVEVARAHISGQTFASAVLSGRAAYSRDRANPAESSLAASTVARSVVC